MTSAQSSPLRLTPVLRLFLLLPALLHAQERATSAAGASTSTIAGCWRGEAALPVGKVEAFLEIEPGKGPAPVRITAIALGLRRASIAASELKDGTVTLETPALGGSYRGTLSEDGTRISGTVTTVAGPMFLDFKRAEAIPPRAQEPRRPYPYAEEQVSFLEEKSGIRFHGTLTIPRGPGPHPAVVLISGLGAHDRDGTVGDSRPFLVLADELTRRGVAVLRCDDRGVGATGGNVMQATSEDSATDALAAAEFLAKRPEIGRGPIGLLGHGEGGMVAMIAAARSPAIRFVVSLAGIAEKCDRLAHQNLLAVTGAESMPEPLRSSARAALHRAVVIVASDATDADVEKQLRGVVPQEFIPALTSRWMRFLARFDPAPAIERVSAPILGLYAAEDALVPAVANASALQAAATRGGNKDVTIVTYPRLDHQFQLAVPTPADGVRCNDTIAPEVLEKVASWVSQKAATRR